MKKITSILLSLFLVLTLFPTTALAEEGTTHSDHCICGANHAAVGDHTSAVTSDKWWPISDGTDLKDVQISGTYYLSNDVTLNSQWKIPNGVNVTLCLNGKTLTASSTGNIDEFIEIKGTLTLTNCKDTGGKITTGTMGSDRHFHVFMVSSGGTLNLYSGTIADIDVKDAYGGGVHNQGTFNMYGGTITRNTAKNGGGVFNDGTYNATFNLYGGTISGNIRTETGKADASDVHNYKNSTMNAYGGTVGGGVFNEKSGSSIPTIAASGESSTTFNGTVTNNGTISGGTFNGNVKNTGNVTGGTFNGNVKNTGAINGGTFGSNGSVTNEMDGNITGGMFNGTVTSAPDKISGATVTGTMVNRYGTLEWNDITNTTAGCVLNEARTELTLTNVYIDVLEVPRTENITIKISGNVTINTLMYPGEDSSPIDSRAVTRASSPAGSITIVSNAGQTTDILYSGGTIYSAGDLTIKDLTANLTVLSSEGSLKLENSKVTVGDGSSLNSEIGASSITMTDPSVLKLDGAVIGAVGESEESNGLIGLKDFIPDGYKISERTLPTARTGGTSPYTITETNGTAPVTNITLQRHYNVTFDPNGGTWSDNTTANVTKRIPINTAFSSITIGTPAKDGSTFDKWTNAQTGGNPVTTITEDITLYAQWTDNNTTPGGTTPGGTTPGGTTPGGTTPGGTTPGGTTPGGTTPGGTTPGGGDDQTPSDDQTPGGEDQTPGGNNGGNNRHHYAKKTNSTDANSAKTFDAGVAVYGVLAVSAALGMGYVGKKKF